MATSRVLSCRIRATFLFPLATLPIYVASFVLRLPYGERRLPQIRFCVRRSYSNRYPPFVLKIHPHSDLKLAAVFPSPIFPFMWSISGKTGLSDSSSYDEGRSRKFEQLDKPSSVSDFIENNLRIDFNSSILFKILILIGMIRTFFPYYVSSSFVSPHSRSSSAKRNQISFRAGLKPWCPVCSITH